jgi:hypothetical protein
MGKKIHAYKLRVRKPKRKDAAPKIHFNIILSYRKDNIKVDLKYIKCNCVELIHLAQDIAE